MQNTTWAIRGTLTDEQRAEFRAKLRAMSPEELDKALKQKEEK